MTHGPRLLFVIALCGAVTGPLQAREEFFRMYRDDPFRSVEDATCAVCHTSNLGGDARNEFGLAFGDAGQTITPVLRASFPDRFGFYSTRLADGSAFHFSDPDNEVVVFERDGVMYPIDLDDVARRPEDIVPPARNRMSFFVTSVGKGNGGHLEGLAGADRHCQELASGVGAGDLVWRAYLSTSFGDRPAVNAGDRIGPGPWFNAKGRLIARGVADLHREGNDALGKQSVLTETGDIVTGFGDEPNRHDILTGTLADGTAAVGLNCNNWTSSGEGQAMVGHHDRAGNGEHAGSWNAAHPTRGCSQEDLAASGGEGLFYCFAAGVSEETSATTPPTDATPAR